MNIIKDNPFRILGVFSNASAKDIAANTHRISAYQRVNREVSFTNDLPNLLGTCDRNEKAVADAQAKINLPNDKIRYALFWFVKGDDADEIVMRHLAAGNIDKAKQILGMGRIFSFKINLGIISLIQGNYKTGIAQITSVIDNDNDRINFVKSVCGETFQIDKQTLKDMFVDGMFELVSPEQLLNIYRDIYNDPVSTKRIKEKVAAQYLDKIDSEIATAKKVDQKDSAASYNAGVRLMNNTKAPLQKLKDLLGVNDMQYTRTADQLANQILQCGINYYNNISSPTRSVVKNAMTLQRYAAQIAVGQLAKDRCGKNIDILNKTLENMPPEGVEEEVRRIENHITAFIEETKSRKKSYSSSSPDDRWSLSPFVIEMSENKDNRINEGKINSAISLLNNTKTDLFTIKNRLGATNSFYLRLSTLIVANSLGVIIDAVNKTQKGEDIGFDLSDSTWMFSGSSSGLSKYHMDCINRIVALAWKATILMDNFDMEESYKSRSYKPNRNTLVSIAQQLGIISKPVVPTGGGSGCMVVIVAIIIFGCIGALLI